MRFTEAVDDFLRVKRREGLTQSTLDGYRRTLAGFAKSLSEDDLALADRRAYDRFIDGFYERGCSKATVAHHWRGLKVFSRWALDEKLIDDDPFTRMKAPKLDVRLHDNLITRDDFDKLIAACPPRTFAGRRDRAVLDFLYETGVRVSELSGLRTDDVDLDAGRAKVWGKGSKERFVFFGPTTALAMEKYRQMFRRMWQKPDPYLFFVSINLVPMTESMVRQMLLRRAKDAGVTRDVNPHAFRHAFATQFLRNGGDLNSLQRLLGHANLAIVTRYLSLVTDDLAEKHARHSPLAR